MNLFFVWFKFRVVLLLKGNLHRRKKKTCDKATSNFSVDKTLKEIKGQKFIDHGSKQVDKEEELIMAMKGNPHDTAAPFNGFMSVISNDFPCKLVTDRSIPL